MRSFLWLLLSLFVSGTTWLYVHRVLDPWEYHMNVEIGTLKAELGDLYSPWVGTRDLLLYKRNPYSPEVSHEIQMAFYGRIVTQAPKVSAQDAVDEQRFAYPVYVVFLMAPTVNLNFVEVETWAPVVLALSTLIGVLLWFDTVRWRPSWPTTAAVFLFVLSTPPIVQGLRLRQLGLVVGFLLALTAWCVSRNLLGTAGIVLALSTIKPQMVALPLLWFVCWAIGDWQKRWRLLAGFVATLVALIGAGELILPGWLHYFFEGLRAYRQYAYRPPLLELALGNTLGEIVSAAVIIGTLAFAWNNRTTNGDSQQFTLVLAAFLAASLLTMPLYPLFNQLLLILPAMIVLRDWSSLRLPARYIFVAILGWPWITSLALLLWFSRGSYPSGLMPLLPAVGTLILPFILPLLLVSRHGT
jgi:hypothetical protein